MDNVIDTVQRMVTLDGACIQTVKPLFDLIVELTQKVHPQASEYNGTRAYAIMKDFRTRLRNPYSEKILSANEYAEHLHITANHLNSVMKQTTNRTTTDWINERKTMEIEMTVSQDEYDMELLAKRCGFAGVPQMSRFYRKMKGRTIKDFRKMIEK